MRMYGYLKNPYKTNKKDTIYKVMLHKTKRSGTLAYLYTSPDAVFSSFDNHYPDYEFALEQWSDEIDERGWIKLDGPLPDCLDCCVVPIRVKEWNFRKPQLGQYEIFIDGKWEDISYEAIVEASKL
jgi:hypothetical protein